MTISNIVTRKLLVAAFALATVSTFSLHAMKRLRDNDGTEEQMKKKRRIIKGQPLGQLPPAYTWFVCKNLNEKMLLEECQLCPDLIKFIFFLNRECILNDHVDDIVQNFEDMPKLFNAIKRVCGFYKPDCAVKIISLALKKAGLSDCDIKLLPIPQLSESFDKMHPRESTCVYLLNQLVNEEGLSTIDLEPLRAFLSAADAINKGWALKLICYASLLLGGKAYVNNNEVTQIMDQYLPSKK